MTKRNAANERIKRRYFAFLKDAKGRDEASIDAAGAWLQESPDRREQHSHGEAVVGIDRARDARRPESVLHVLADQRGYASRIKYVDAEYFSAPDDLSRMAMAKRFKPCPTVAQVRAMLDAMPTATEVQRRDRALVAFAILSGARDRAIISFRLKHVDIERGLIEHDARDVRTKRAKTFTTWFFPVGDDIRQIFVDWVVFLREQKGFGPDDPLFPKTKVPPGDDLEFRAVSIDRAPWSNANAVRSIVREACARARIAYFNPHLLRNTLVQLATN